MAHHGWARRKKFQNNGCQKAGKQFFDITFANAVNTLTIRSFNCCASFMKSPTIHKLPNVDDVVTQISFNFLKLQKFGSFTQPDPPRYVLACV